MKRIKDHVRCEVLISKGRCTLVNYVEVDKAYSSEVKMLGNILRKVEIKGNRFIADRCMMLYSPRYLKGYQEAFM